MPVSFMPFVTVPGFLIEPARGLAYVPETHAVPFRSRCFVFRGIARLLGYEAT